MDKLRRNFASRRAQDGIALVLVLCYVSLLCAMLLPLLGRVITEARLTQRSYSSTAAIDLAEAGVEAAAWEILYGGKTFTAGKGWNTQNVGGVNCKTLSNTLDDANGNQIGEYVVAVPVADITANYIEIISTGYQPNQAAPKGERTVRVILKKDSPFSYGLFSGSTTVPFSLSGNSSTDSYNSDQGYAASKANNGSIASNSNITLSGNADVKGNATPGLGKTVTTSGNAAVTGSKTPATSVKTLPAIEATFINNAKVNNVNGAIPKTLTINGNNTTTLPTSGTYYFDSISVSGNGKLVIPVGVKAEIVVNGDFSVSGNGQVNNQSQLPPNLKLYCTGASFSLSGNATFYGAVYAPNALVSISGNGTAFGAMAANTFSFSGNETFHYDEKLAQEAVGFMGYQFFIWQEK